MSSLRNEKRGSSYLVSAPEGGSVEFVDQHSQGTGAYYMETYLKKKRVYWVKFSPYKLIRFFAVSLLFIAALTTFRLAISFKLRVYNFPERTVLCSRQNCQVKKVSSNKRHQLRTYSTRIRHILINVLLT